MTLIAIAAAVLAFLLVAQAAGAQETQTPEQDTPAVASDRTEYLGNDFATVTLTGAQACAGQEVYLGFWHGDSPEEAEVRATNVNANGTASVEMQLPLAGFIAPAAALGACLPEGLLIAVDDTIVEEFYPDFTVTGVFVDFEDSRTVTVERLHVCSGQDIMLGVAGAPLAPVTVDSAGSATVQVPLVEGPWWPVIEGDCVPGGRYLQDQTPDGVWIDNVPAIALDFRSDAATYEVGDTAHVSVYGLGPCVDQTALLGLFDADGHLVLGQQVSVGTYGGASADIVVPGPRQVVYAGATGDCLGGEVLMSGEPITIQRSVPLPPEVGTGLADGGEGTPGSSLAFVAAALLGLGLAVAGIARRVR